MDLLRNQLLNCSTFGDESYRSRFRFSACIRRASAGITYFIVNGCTYRSLIKDMPVILRYHERIYHHLVSFTVSDYKINLQFFVCFYVSEIAMIDLVP